MKFHGDIPFFHQIGQDSSFRGATDRVSNYSWGGVSNPSAVIDISRGEEKFRSLISAILCLEILSPCSLPRDIWLYYRERRLQNVCFEKIYKLRGSKIRGSEKNNPGNLSKLFCRDFSRIRKIFLLILAAPLINFIPSFPPSLLLKIFSRSDFFSRPS